MDSGTAALLGTVIGTIGGLVATLGGTLLNEAIKSYRRKEDDRPRKALLKLLLEDQRFGWRHLSTLSRVTGLTDTETKRLLIEIGARGSEGDEDDWALIARQPFRGPSAPPGP